MYSDNRSLNLKDEKTIEKIIDRKVSFSDQTSCGKSDSCVVDMERFSHLMEKDINNNRNSRITLQRNISRKGSFKNGDMKIKDDNRETVTTSPKAGSTPEKPRVVAVGAANLSHHQITITGGSPAADIKSTGGRFGFRRAQPVRICDPKRILFLFATLSSMGTILLIYFTLSMEKLNGEGNASI
ncbi:Unknown protein [Striga hermonthica]|uniref:Transmembrane protein n=1 Tax=Striga hermonthica TaxID=68872 RepID=A0A9N7RLI1_STRHE|nr:Unknown protein [Striga hermonthica]